MALFAEELNPASAPQGTITFLPGGGLGGWSWREVAHRLPEYRCLLVDLPEHGQSRDVGSFTMQRAAEEVRRKIVERASGSSHVVGLSLGAQVAVQLLAVDSGVVTSAFLSGCSVRPVPLLGRRGLLELLFRLYAPFQNWPWLVRANRRTLGVPDAYAREFSEDTRRLSPEMLARIVAANQAFRLPPSLSGVRTPTVVAVGGRELGLVKRSAKDLARTLANATAMEVAGRPHGWPISEPDLAAAAIRAFLRGGSLPDAFRPLYSTAGSRT